MALLSMSNISKSFFGKPALDKVNLKVEPGEIHALLGENGAGKTTLMNILYGIYTRDEGEIVWKGEPVSFSSPKDAIERRIGMVHQHFMLVPTLTVSQNITLGLKSKGHPFPDRKELNASILEISQKYGLEINPEAYVSSLSVGEQQRVEIIKLLYRNAELLILDEPTGVLTPQETESFFNVLRKLRDDGHSVIVITHRIPEVMSITDRVTVLRDGKNVATVVTKDITEEQLSKYMIGRELKVITKKPSPAYNQKGLVLKDVTCFRGDIKRLDSVSLQIGKGEIVGIAGVDGNGQKELAEVITGIARQSEGEVWLGEVDLSHMSVMERKKLGLGYVSDDRHHDGLVLDMDLAENILLKTHTEKACLKGFFINQKLVKENTQKAVGEYGIKTNGIEVPIRYLSGGNQQKLILARELAGEPTALVAFQPTRGLDIGATEFIQQKLLEQRQKGCSILLISADLEEITALSDRIAVIYKGRIMGIVENNEKLDLAEVGLMMAGTEKGVSA
jgi:ABC-type uncharacterized transport system ATPase subunit